VDDEDALREFITARSAALLRNAYLLVGDRAHAEDLLQTALIKTYLAWPRIRDHAALESYVRRTMATNATSWWRGRRFRERPLLPVPDRAEGDPVGPRIEHDAMWALLRSLPTRQRAVLVLRYYEGLSEAEIAETLRMSRGTVKSHAARGRNALRDRLTRQTTIENRRTGVQR
jgi:RNA polymerase sigma-70 factor (sigma-E family)